MWTPLKLEMRQAVESVRLKAGRISSSHAFVSMFLWKEQMGLSIWLESEGYLVRQECRGKNHYFFPCGNDETKKKMLSSLSADAVLHYADAQDLAFLEQWQPGRFQTQPARKDWEYLYNRQAQVALSGARYSKMRHRVHQARSLSGWRACPMDAQTLPPVKSLEIQWQNLNRDRLGAADSLAVNAALEHFEALALFGVLVFRQERPVGYFLGAFLEESTFCGMVSRALNPSYFPAIRWELCNALPRQILTVNWEEDLGLEGLRQNKTERNPDGFYEMWDVAQSLPKESKDETIA